MVNALCSGYTYKENTLKYISQAESVKLVNAKPSANKKYLFISFYCAVNVVEFSIEDVNTRS